MEIHRESHYKARALMPILEQNYNYQVSRRFVERVLGKCRTCQKTKSSHKPCVALVPLPVESGVFSRIQVDLIELTSQPSRLDHRYVMCILDCFTKYLWTYPLHRKCQEELRFYFNYWITDYGVPGIIQTDNGREFNNSEVEDLFAELLATVVHGRPRHPETQGKVESVNKSLKSLLRTKVVDTGEDWLDLLQHTTASYNNRRNTSIETNPFEAMFGRPKALTGFGAKRRLCRRVEDDARQVERAGEVHSG